MFDIQKDLVLVQDVIDTLFSTIYKIATKKPIDLQEVPEAPAEGEEGDFEDKVAEIKETNANAEAENAKFAKIQTKIQIKVRLEDDYREESEKALVKLNNWRETMINEAGQVVVAGIETPVEGQDPVEADEFNIEKIPTKILITSTKIGESGNVVALFHPEAAYSVRKVLMEAARRTFKELEKAEVT